ncbi:S8 family serine peptidase [Enterococcus timonensis]|uniref:S8 family serine peptidase n=1 Tax=Enterococcus timonensis TaxID=1852364 RepID=UPI0008D98725|nr:S8 family serine peptidase [Enterococcus timonensis]
MESKKSHFKFRHLFLLSTLALNVAGSLVAPSTQIFASGEATTKVESAEKQTLEQLVREKNTEAQKVMSDTFLTQVKTQLAAKGVNTADLSAEELGNQPVRVIVNLSGQAAVESQTQADVDFASADAAEEKVLAAQETVQQQVEEITSTKVAEEFGYLVNGFSIDATANQVEAISKLDSVESVEVTNVEEAMDTTAGQLIQVQQAWEENSLKGEGMVIAIIDSGIDSTHKDLRLSDESTAKISEADAKSVISELGYGKYESAKVPFGHNYADGNDDDLSANDGVMHGMHVAGIAAANGENPDNATSVAGVAPEAQLLNLRVFPETNADGPTTDTIIQAIEDSVKLGADVINMSLGSDDGGSSEVSAELDAVNNAAAAGVLPVIAAGNSGLSTSMGGVGNISTYEATDDGLMSSPANAKEALTVASSENTSMRKPFVSFFREKEELFDGEKLLVQTADLANNLFPSSRRYIVAGDDATTQANSTDLPLLGKYEDFSGQSTGGKVLVVSRGEISFAEKQQNAISLNAAGLIIINNVANNNDSAGIDNNLGIPTLFVSYEVGQKLLEKIRENPDVTYSFSDVEEMVVDNPDAKKMSNFSTWGPNTNLDIKPDITAPGGQIWSLANDNQYQSMNGTSIASPMAAGAEALVLQGIKERGLNLSGLELTRTAKLLTMNTAEPILDAEAGNVPYSPRYQGAGQIQIANALQSSVTLTYNDQPSAALKNIGSSTEFSVTLTNHGQNDASFSFNNFGGVYTKAVEENGLVHDALVDGASLTPDANEITVAAGESKEVKINLELPTEFASDQWAEGYLGFTSLTEDQANLSMPYLGYFGDWNEVEVFDQPAWEEDTQFYGNYFMDYDQGTVLGVDFSYEDYTGSIQYDILPEDVASYETFVNPDKVAISPNGDTYKDSALIYQLINRHVKEISQQILNEDGTVVRDLNSDYDGHKVFVNGEGTQLNINSYISMTNNRFDGKAFNQKTGLSEALPDGQYYYQISATPDVDNGTPQTLTLPMKIDTVNPEISNLAIQKEEDGLFHLTGHVDEDFSGLSDWTTVGVSINGYSYYFYLGDASFDAYLEDAQDGDTIIKEKDFNIPLEEFSSVFKNGANEVKVGIVDNADNFGEVSTTIDVTVDENHGGDLIVYNVYDSVAITDTNTFYDPETKTFLVYGYNPRDFYLNGQLVQVDEQGLFETRVPIDETTKKLTFSLDASNKRILKELTIGFAYEPTAEFDKENGEWFDYGTQDVYVIKNKTDTIRLTGKVTSGTADEVGGELTPQNAEAVGFSYKFDPITNIFSATIPFYQDSSFFEGDNIISATAYRQAGDLGAIAGGTDFVIVRQLGQTALSFENVTDGGIIFYRADEALANGYNPDTQTFTVTGDASEIEDFRILVNPTNPEDPANQVQINEDGTFNFDLNINPTDQKIYSYSFRFAGQDTVNYGSFGISLDTVFPHLNLAQENSWQISQQEGIDYEVYTNSDQFTLAGTMGDDLSGYTLYLGTDEEYKDAFNGSLKTKFTTEDKNFERIFDLYETDDALDINPNDQDNDNLFVAILTEVMGNSIVKTILVHQSSAEVEMPEVVSDNESLTKDPVHLTATQTESLPIYYSLDDGETWTLYSGEITKALNGEVLFKAVDQYGNESDLNAYSVENIVLAVASLPKADLTDFGPEVEGVEVTLSFADELTEEQLAYTHLRYSIDGGATWLEYTEPFSVLESTEVLIQSYDDAGNSSEATPVWVNVPEKTTEDGNTPVDSNNSGEDETPVDSNNSGEDDTKSDDQESEAKLLGQGGDYWKAFTDDLKENTETPEDYSAENTDYLPNTGEKQSNTWSFVGLILVALGATSWVYVKRKKVNVGEK